ncbi:MAG: hypothetical protein UF085_03745 [Collinsella sp.]|nr:hypothetical protein [Collinsella sp.]
MHPEYVCSNKPVSITDADGPFLIIEAELFNNDELNGEFKKNRARHNCSCASAAAVVYYCKSLAADEDNPWYESWEKAVEQYPLEKRESATMLYWIEPTDPLTALDARYPQSDLEPYVSKAIRVAGSYLVGLDDKAYSINRLDVEDVDNLLTAAWFLIQKLQEGGRIHDPDALDKIEDATYDAHAAVKSLIEGEEAAKASVKSDDNL